MNKEVSIDTGQKIWKLSINIPTSEGNDIIYPKGIHIKEFSIVYQNESKYALSDPSITVIDKYCEFKGSFGIYFDKANISVKTNDSYFSNGIFMYVYSTKKVDSALIEHYKDCIRNYIKKEYSFIGRIDELIDGLKNEED